MSDIVYCIMNNELCIKKYQRNNYLINLYNISYQNRKFHDWAPPRYIWYLWGGNDDTREELGPALATHKWRVAIVKFVWSAAQGTETLVRTSCVR